MSPEACTIRPLTTRIPATQKILDESNLPLACVVTPYWNACDELFAGQLTEIPKCLHCGAPHPNTSTYYPLGSTMLLCYLCGRVSNVAEKSTATASASSKPATFCLPLRHLGGAKDTGKEPIYRVPAISCPPLWFVVLDGTATSHARYATSNGTTDYWTLVRTCFIDLVAKAPPFVHCSLLLVSSYRWDDSDHYQLSIIQMHAPMPHVLQYDTMHANLDDIFAAIVESLTPVAQIVAEQSWMKCLTCNSHRRRRKAMDGDQVDSSRVSSAKLIRWTTQALLEALDSHGVAPLGQPATDRHYAGGKISFLLESSSPSASEDSVDQGRIWNQPVGHRFETQENGANGDSHPDSSFVDWTTASFSSMDAIEKTGWDESLQLAVICAEQAIGVDMIGVGGTVDDCIESLPLIIKTGPPLVCTDQRQLLSKLESIAPWKDQVFGADFRFRSSPGVQVDVESVDPQPQSIALAPIYCQGGCVGPACVVDTHLWHLGSCHKHTSLTLDLYLTSRRVSDRMTVDGVGYFNVQPVLQTCMAYTAIVEHDGSYWTVRRMRIDSYPLSLAQSVEAMYDSIDNEVLATVLFHKIATASFQEGLSQSPEIAESWLQSLLVCAYRSAEQEAIIQDSQKEKGIVESNTDRQFVANERLLDRPGDLSPHQVLLGQGHPILAAIPLMVYLLLQCDALRPTANFSLASRVTACWQMAHMVPSTLTRALAPRIQLWGADAEPILEVLDLSNTGLLESILEFQGQTREPLVIFMDSPHLMLIIKAEHILPSAKCSDVSARLSHGLQLAVEQASDSYRVRPRICVSLDKKDETSVLHLVDALAEDAATRLDENFQAWKLRIAEGVNSDLLESL